MFKAKQSVSLVRAFNYTQFKIAFICTLCCSILFFAVSSHILQSFIHQNSVNAVSKLQSQLENIHNPKNRLQLYEELLTTNLQQLEAMEISLQTADQKTITQVSSSFEAGNLEKMLNRIFFATPIQASFKNNIENGFIVFKIRSYQYIFYYILLLATISTMFLCLPLILSLLLYQSNRFLNQNISPLVQAIHQFDTASFAPAKNSYSYIREIQFFSETFNALLNKFESTKQNLAEQNVLLEQQAHHDVLTKLPNRQYFQKFLLKEFNHNQNSNMVVLFIDNNKFKAINDTYGHQAGDAVLIETAHRLCTHLKADDFIARLGGDEFAVILRRIEHYQELVDICEKLRFSCFEPLFFENKEIIFSFSIGASYAYHANSIEELLHHADLAMYKAKLSEKKWHIYKREETFAYTQY